jgi:hypothetical protein
MPRRNGRRRARSLGGLLGTASAFSPARFLAFTPALIAVLCVQNRAFSRRFLRPLKPMTLERTMIGDRYPLSLGERVGVRGRLVPGLVATKCLEYVAVLAAARPLCLCFSASLRCAPMKNQTTPFLHHFSRSPITSSRIASHLWWFQTGEPKLHRFCTVFRPRKT